MGMNTTTFANLSVKQRLTAGFVLVILVMLMPTLISFHGLSRTESIMKEQDALASKDVAKTSAEAMTQRDDLFMELTKIKQILVMTTACSLLLAVMISLMIIRLVTRAWPQMES